MRLRQGDLIGAVLALAVVALFVRLGFWQIARLRERQAQNAIIAARRELPPVELPMHHFQADALRDRRAHARGVYDYARERVWGGRTFEGAPGVALLTPLRLSDGSAVFVDRGFAASPDAAHVDQARYREGDTVEVSGLILPAPRDRRDVNPEVLRDSLPYSLLPAVVQVDDSAAPHPPGLHRWPPPTLGSGSHLPYAIVWFSLALISMVGAAQLLWMRAREGMPPLA